MSVITKFELKASDSTGAELQTFLSRILPETRTYVGCEGADFGISEEASDTILLVEKWNSKADFEAYLNWRIETGDFAELGSLLAEEPSIIHFTAH